jgi:hypothetical protein
MTVEELIDLATRRIQYLAAQRSHAEQIGDLTRIIQLEAEIAETQNTLNKLTQVA